jgi:dynein heavy chain
MDDLDPPQVYGQHINAEISSQITDSKDMLASILEITPQKGSGGGDGGSSGVVKLIRELRDKVPEEIDYFRLK